MKLLISILAISICAGCATSTKPTAKNTDVVPGTSVSANRLPTVRSPEMVKAYPVGRYIDPNYPDEMHERHAVYRREQSPDWNYLPDPPVALPLGPTVSTSNPSPSYYSKAEGELNAQQRAYAEALQEQNRAMKKRIETLQQEAANVQGLELEINKLKKQIEDAPKLPPADPSKTDPDNSGFEDVFSESDSYRSVIGLVADHDQGCDFLIAQMRLNNEFTAQLAAAEQRKGSAIFRAPILAVWNSYFSPQKYHE